MAAQEAPAAPGAPCLQCLARNKQLHPSRPCVMMCPSAPLPFLPCPLCRTPSSPPTSTSSASFSSFPQRCTRPSSACSAPCPSQVDGATTGRASRRPGLLCFTTCHPPHSPHAVVPVCTLRPASACCSGAGAGCGPYLPISHGNLHSQPVPGGGARRRHGLGHLNAHHERGHVLHRRHDPACR
jgi:hypothetical protein